MNSRISAGSAISVVRAGMEAAAQKISEAYGCAVLCKGGHKENDADDLLWRDGKAQWFHGERIANPNTHGTGCTLSSAIASNLAKGYDLEKCGRLGALLAGKIIGTVGASLSTEEWAQLRAEEQKL